MTPPANPTQLAPQLAVEVRAAWPHLDPVHRLVLWCEYEDGDYAEFDRVAVSALRDVHRDQR